MIRIAIIGYGKIARDQHAPAIAANSDFELVATAGGGRGGLADNVPHYADQAELLQEQGHMLDAVAICTPPGPRTAIARDCLQAGLDVLLEKPPAATLGEVAAMEAMAQAKGRTLFATWHSQCAPAVARAADLLRGEQVTRFDIVWHEDVRQWHPGQDWIFEAGGYGIFDTGINALSIATAVLPDRLTVRDCSMTIPHGRQGPIAASLRFDGGGSASLDWRVAGQPVWSFSIETAAGRRIEIADGGGRLTVDGAPQHVGQDAEYPMIYRRFAELVSARQSQVDSEPLRIVADAFMVASREAGPPFDWTPGV
jgi:predicted dehydrogenase